MQKQIVNLKKYVLIFISGITLALWFKSIKISIMNKIIDSKFDKNYAYIIQNIIFNRYINLIFIILLLIFLYFLFY